MCKKIPQVAGLLVILGLLLGACGPVPTVAPTQPPAPTAPAVSTQPPAPTAPAAPTQPPATSVPNTPTRVPPTQAPTAVPSTPAAKVITRPMVVCSDLEAVSMDPHTNDYAYSSAVQYGPYEALLRWTKRPDGSWGPGPHLAKSWDVSSDSLTYTFRLNDGIKFSDGTGLDAKAVKWNFDRLIALGLQPSTKLYLPKDLKVEVVDNSTIKITLPSPYAPFLYGLVDVPMMVSPTTAAAHQKDGKFGANGDYSQGWLNDNAVGTGPYLLKEWRRGESATLVKNPNYWQGWDGNHLDSIVVKVVGEVATRKLMLEGGECDFTLRLNDTDLPSLEGNAKVVVYKRPANTSINVQIKPQGAFADKRVRQAIALAFDYDAFVNKILLGRAEVANGPLSAADFGWDATLAPFKRDLAKAKQLMAQAGYANGVPGEFELWILPSFQTWQRSMGELFQANMAEIGVKVKLVEIGAAAPLLAGAFNADVTKPPTFFPWILRPRTGDPDTTLRDHYYGKSIPPNKQNGAFYVNPQFDTLLDEGMKGTDPNKRAPIYKNLQNILIQDQPWVWLAYQPSYYFLSKDLKGYDVAPLLDSYVPLYYRLWLEGK